MKKYIVVLLSLVFFACSNKPEKITVKGVNKGESSTVTLKGVVDGEYIVIAEDSCKQGESFVIEVENKEGFFYLNSGEHNYFYLNKGEEIDFSKAIVAEKQIVKKIEVINNWAEKVVSLRPLAHDKSISIQEYVKRWELIKEEIIKDLKEINDDRFNKLFNLQMRSVSEISKMRTLSMRGIFDFSSIKKEDFYGENDFSDSDILKVNGTKMWVRNYFYWNSLFNPNYYKKDESSIKQDALLIKDKEVKSLFVYEHLKALKKLTIEIREDLTELKEMLLERHIGIIDVVTEKFRGLSPGDKAFDFKFKSNKGNTYFSLADFKGKYILMDLWATWCAPCKAQTPYFKKLAKEFQGENIEFITLSFDKDRKAWLKYIKEHDLNGINLIVDNGFNSEFSKFYKLTGIPRFILIDSEGKLVDAFAPRPSDPRLKMQIKRELNK